MGIKRQERMSDRELFDHLVKNGMEKMDGVEAVRTELYGNRLEDVDLAIKIAACLNGLCDTVLPSGSTDDIEIFFPERTDSLQVVGFLSEGDRDCFAIFADGIEAAVESKVQDAFYADFVLSRSSRIIALLARNIRYLLTVRKKVKPLDKTDFLLTNDLSLRKVLWTIGSRYNDVVQQLDNEGYSSLINEEFDAMAIEMLVAMKLRQEITIDSLAAAIKTEPPERPEPFVAEGNPVLIF